MAQLENLIHIARVQSPTPHYLFLRRVDDCFQWFDQGQPTAVSGHTIEEAMRLAWREWKEASFAPLNCGFLYTLPVRDETGINAYFYQMAASYASPNGVFFDQLRGHLCRVDNASRQALELLNVLTQSEPVCK